jgi:hypothetical protein
MATTKKSVKPKSETVKFGKFELPINDPNLVRESYYEDNNNVLETVAYAILNQLPIFVIGDTGCVDKETEYLTTEGWKKISDYNNEDIATYTKEGNMFFEKPEMFIEKKATTWYQFKTKYGLNQKLSGEHRVVYITSKGNLQEKSMNSVYDNQTNTINGFKGKFITTFNYSGDTKLPYDDDYIRLLVAVSADGSYNHSSWRINIKKQRKINRLEYLLDSCDIKYKRTYSPTTEQFSYYFKLNDGFREFPKSWYKLNKEQRKIICSEILLWNGNTKNTYYSNIKSNANFIQFIFSSCGYRASILEDNHRENTNYIVTRTKRVLTSMMGRGDSKPKITRTEPKENEYKYCFRTSTSYWIARRGDRIFITGNCGKSALFRHIADVTGNKITRVSLNGGITTDELVGHTALTAVDGQVITDFKQNILPDCLEKGEWLFVDELPAAVPEVNFIFHELLDDERQITLLDSSPMKKINWGEGFQFFAAGNPPTGGYIGNNDLNIALKSRFPITIDLEYPNDSRIIQKMFGFSSGVADKIHQVAINCRNIYRKGESSYPCGTRDVINWARNFKAFDSIKKSFEITILHKFNPGTEKESAAFAFETIFPDNKIKSSTKLASNEDALRDEIDNLESELSSKDTEIEELRNTSSNDKSVIKDLESEVEILQEKASEHEELFNSDMKDKLTSILNRANTNKDKYVKQIKRLEEEIKQLKTEKEFKL